MNWVLVFGGIALVSLVGLAAYAVWLWHKAEDVLAEVAMVGRQAEAILGLVDDIAAFEPARRDTGRPSGPAGDADDVRSRQVDLSFEPDFGRGAVPRFATERHH